MTDDDTDLTARGIFGPHAIECPMRLRGGVCNCQPPEDDPNSRGFTYPHTVDGRQIGEELW